MSSDPFRSPGSAGGPGSADAPASEADTGTASETGTPQTPPTNPNGGSGEPLVSPREQQAAAAAYAAAEQGAAESGGDDAAPATEPAEAYEEAGEELAQLQAKAAKADEYLLLAQRKQAEFENFRKRSIRDAAAAQERGAVKLAMALLPAIDNLERALEHAPDESDEHGFVAGVRHVHVDLVAALEKHGIERFSPAGEMFDPNQHEAVAQQPIEGAEPGAVVEVFQPGYRIGETVVRPARVVVAG